MLIIYHLTLKVVRETRANISYFDPTWILFRFVIRFYKTSVSDLEILHVDTRGICNISSAVKFHYESTTNHVFFEL